MSKSRQTGSYFRSRNTSARSVYEPTVCIRINQICKMDLRATLRFRNKTKVQKWTDILNFLLGFTDDEREKRRSSLVDINMLVMDTIMDDHYLIGKIMDRFTHEIASEVDFHYLKPYLCTIFTRHTLQRAEGRDRASYDIMTKICDSIRTRSMCDFLQFLAAIRMDYRHVFNEINTYYREATGNNLPDYENTPNLSQAAPILQQNSPGLAQNEPVPPYNAQALLQNAPDPPQIAPLPQHNVSIPQQNTSVVSQNAEPFEHSISAAGYMDVSNPNELGMPETFHSSHDVSGSPVETTEPSIALGHINYTSLGPAVPCPSDLLSPPGNPVSFGSSEQLSGDLLLQSRQNSVGGSASEAISPDRYNPPSHGVDVPPGAAVGQRDTSSELSKYNRLIIKNPNSVYTMESTPRGHCLIINNEEFQILSPRRGSSEDLNNLDRMFKFLGFQVVSYENKTAREMKILLKEFARSPALDQISSLAVVILSHGGPNDIIYGKDGTLRENSPVAGTFITKLQLQQIFSGRNCPTMNGKPKLFILQACRGDVEDDRDRSSSNNLGESEDDDTSSDHTGEPETVSDYPLAEPRAETADMYFLHASSLGYKAYRSTSKGSPFIETFTEHVSKHAHEKSLEGIVRMIQDEFSTKAITSTKMTMPESTSRLTKKWYFNPPHGES